MTNFMLRKFYFNDKVTFLISFFILQDIFYTWSVLAKMVIKDGSLHEHTGVQGPLWE